MKILGEWKNVTIQGKGSGFLRLEQREGRDWIALYEQLSVGNSIQERTEVAVDAIKENPEAAAGAALTAAANGAVKAVAAKLGADHSAMRRIQVFENDSAKEFSKTFAESNDAVLRKHLIFEKELSNLSRVSNSGNSVYILLDAQYCLTFENQWSGENMSRELQEKLEPLRKKNEAARLSQGIDWTLDTNRLLTIKGRGKMPDWDWNVGDVETPWYTRRKEIKRVDISNGFTNIGDYAFYECENLTYVRIPNGVTSIGASAFTFCKNLYSIDIPSSVTKIEDSAFNNCSILTNIHIPHGVTEIQHLTFHDCSLLSSVNVPNSVTGIGRMAFSGCKNLSTIHIPNSVTRIEAYAFNYCSSLINISIPNSVTSIGDGAFEECESLSEIRIPNSVTKLGTGVFKNCKKLKKVWMPARFDGPFFKLRYGISKDIVTFT